ncbi:hypothetical protein V6Z11_A05G460500 [Gossypium hirsutum]
MRHRERRLIRPGSKGVIFGLKTPFSLRYRQSERGMVAGSSGTEQGACTGVVLARVRGSCWRLAWVYEGC